MSCQIAVAVFPFDGRFRASRTIPTGLDLGRTIATLARLDELFARASIVAAAFGGHKRAFGTFANGVTNHGNHPLLRFYLRPLKMARGLLIRPLYNHIDNHISGQPII
jgi:hypothetical protein